MGVRSDYGETVISFVMLSPQAVSDLRLPSETKNTLSTRGIPDEVRLPGWQGPTLFTPEIRSGRIRVLSECFTDPRSRAPDSYVVGSIRETSPGGPHAPLYAYFVIAADEGAVLLVDVASPAVPVRFVNSMFADFLDSLELFLVAWAHVLRGDRSGVESVRSEMARVDPRAWESDDAYWPVWFEEIAAEE